MNDHEAELLRSAAAQMRGTELDRSDQGGDFTIDGLEEYSWHAVSFGARWNGWATPIVTAATLQNLIGDLAEIDGKAFGEIQSDGRLLVLGEEPEDNHEIAPNERGQYHLHVLGWCFLQCG